MSDLIRLQVLIIGNRKNYLMFGFSSQWSSNSGTHDKKDYCEQKFTFKAYFTFQQKSHQSAQTWTHAHVCWLCWTQNHWKALVPV